jgi:hypothetical protein
VNKQKQVQLFTAFPLLYKDSQESPRKSCLYWGICTGDGWFEILWELSKALEEEIVHAKKGGYLCECGHNLAAHSYSNSPCGASHEYREKLFLCPCKGFTVGEPRAAEVKQKFGKLRFYGHSFSERMHGLVKSAERVANKTCEKCGQAGELRPKGWLKTLCDACVQVEANQEERNEGT